MNRSTFDTGKDHQKKAAIWVRRRLVDQKGILRSGSRRVPQHGVLLADGVGMGKTWEALAASALLLVERSKRTKSGKKRRRRRRQPARILVLCPPGLVSKWTREIRDPEGFQECLEAWKNQSKNREFVRKTLTEPYEIRRKQDLDELRPTRKRKQIQLTEGIYVCNCNVVNMQVGAGNRRLAALRSQRWDLVIADEAHHREVREALNAILRSSRGVKDILLLTATPFQLDPKELHPLLGIIIDRTNNDHKVLSRGPVARFAKSLERFFHGGDPPARSEKKNAEEHLQQLIVRNVPLNKGRRYFAINAQGEASALNPPPDRRNEQDLMEITPLLIQPEEQFESWYLRRRLELAAAEGADRTFVPTKLRRALSTREEARDPELNSGARPPSSPRMDALFAWARKQIEVDLRRFIRDGLPRKILVFTSFVSNAADELRRGLEKMATEAWHVVKQSRQWKQMIRCAPENLRIIQRKIEAKIAEIHSHGPPPRVRKVVESMRELVNQLVTQKKDGVLRDLFGQRRFRDLVIKDLQHQLDVLRKVTTGERQERWQERLHRYELKRLADVVEAQRSCNIVSTYTGNDDRREREAAGETFCSPLGPWALVASNVGSEGIDLQTFSKHLVHFDIEWNPARMEQREGRIDRIGRKLREKEHVNIYFLLVRGTYDERMLHQLVARQRWHSILLGRPAAKLTKDMKVEDARPLDVADSHKWTLDLRPRR